MEEALSRFDDRQRRAVKAILDEWSSGEVDDFVFPIIDGPPGTGKTTVGTTALAKYLLENRKGQVVYMCYTNFATAKAQENFSELGLAPSQVLRLHSNPRQTDWTKGIVGCTYNLSNLSFNDRRRLKECGILLCTLYGARRASEVRRTGPRIIIDEFSQVTPALFFQILRRFRYKNPGGYALLGDPRQLPILSSQPMLTPNIGLFIMKRKAYRSHELVIQHRMHKGICEAVNSLRAALRTYRIKTGKDVKDRDLLAMGYKWNENNVSDETVREILDPKYPFVIVNTDKLGGTEKRAFGGSIVNTEEADLTARLTRAIRDCYRDKHGRPLKPIVLSPYSAQVGEIRRRLSHKLGKGVCTTIYRSQGREYPCVIVSFVRNNPEGFIGFLKDPALRAQTYVACSRAQAKLIILLSFQTFIGYGHLDFEYLNETQGAHTVTAGSR